MSNPYYTHTTYPTPNSPGSSATMRNELENVTLGFDLLPTLAANGYKVAMVNSAGTALIASAALQSLAITSSTLNSTPIGATTAAAGTFTNLTITGTANLGSTTVITGGTINGTPIGGTTASTGAFTTVSASSGFTGNLIGDTSGTHTGAVTGNVAGNLTGNVTASSGTSTFNNITISGTLDMDAGTTNTIINLATPTNAGDAATKGYVDTGLALKLALAGGTMSGAIAMGTSKITGMGDPTNAQDAATKTYVDTADALKLALAGGTMSGAIAMGTSKITGLGDPTAAQDAATKNYVDNTVQGLDAKASCRVGTTANITLSGTQTIDGVAVIAGDRVLVKDQTTTANNGIYVAAASTWARSTDADTWDELVHAYTFVESGTVNANNGFVCTIAPGGTLGSTSVTWVQFSGAGQITAGAGLTKTGNTLNVGTASSSRIVVNSDDIDLATTAVTAGTYQSMTVDAYGRVTAGTNPTTLAGYNISNAYTTTQVDTALALKLNLTGGTMSGAIAMGTSKITGLGDPTNIQDAATKSYVDTGLALKLSLTGGTMSGAIAMGASKITGLADPTANQDATTKFYVDGILGSATSAAASAAAAAVSETNAGNSATAASGSATAAAGSATAAAASFDSFDDRYLGAKASDPAVDNDGNALLTGALYFNTTTNEMRVYSGSAWLTAYLPATGYLALSGGTMTGAITFAGAQTWPTFNQNTTGTAAGLSATLATTSGGTGLTSFTSGGVVYASSSSALATGSGLVFDGTNLGIGNTSPTSYNGAADNLVIGTSGNNGMTIVSGSTSSGYIMFADGTTGQQQYEGQITYDHTNNFMAFNTSGIERMRIASDTGGVGAVGIGYTSLTSVGNNGLAVLGNVGIGTSSPAARLHVSTTSSNISIAQSSAANGGYLEFSNGSTSPLYVGFGATLVTGISTSDAALRYSNNLVFGNGGSEVARFISGGNLGLGTTSPNAQIEVSRSSTSGYSTFRLSNSGASGKTYEIGVGGNAAAAGYANSLYFYDSSASALRFVFGPSGQFGIGGATYGNAGEVLTSGGSGAAPTWAAAGGGGTTNGKLYFYSSFN